MFRKHILELGVVLLTIVATFLAQDENCRY